MFVLNSSSPISLGLARREVAFGLDRAELVEEGVADWVCGLVDEVEGECD